MEMSRRIVVIGSGAAGMSAASAARKASSNAEITVITRDEDVSYSPCAIPWGIEGRSGWDEIVMHDPEFYRRERNIEVVTRTDVESVDPDARTVTAGGRTYPYDALVLATGGSVFVPPVEGRDLDNVFVVRTVRDGKDIQRALEGAERVVIGGAGVIGLELAVSISAMGKDVTVVEMMDQIVPRIADKDISDRVQAHLEERGIKFVLKAPIQAVNGDGKVESITAAGVDYPCDVMIFATGVRANLDIPKALGLDIGQLNALDVAPTLNVYRRGRLVPDIYAAGDVIQCQSAVMPGPTMSQLGSTAVKQGIVAGNNAAGGPIKLFGAVCSPWVSVIGDLQVAGTGLSLGLAAWYGIDVVCGEATGLTRARYYPGGRELTVKVLADRTTHRLVGAQIVAGEEATGRINWLTCAIADGMTAETFLAESENAYCPPTNMVRDVVFLAMEDLCDHLNQ